MTDTAKLCEQVERALAQFEAGTIDAPLLIERLVETHDCITTALKELQAENERLTLDGIHTCHDQCQRIACVQRREIAQLKAENERLREASRPEVVAAQEGWSHDIHRVAFRAGFILCREYMARFVEQGGDTSTATSIRANWMPSLGADPGPPRRLKFDECVKAENMEEGPWEPIDPDLCAEAACYALCAAHDMGLAFAQEIIAAEAQAALLQPKEPEEAGK